MDPESISGKAADMSKLGASKGGRARAQQLSAEERRRIASRAAEARWGQPVHFAPYPGVIEIGDISIACAVLEDETRVLSQATVLRALGRNPEKSRRARSGSTELRAPFLYGENLQQFITPELSQLAEPIRYRVAGEQGNPSWGYRAEMLPLVCEVYLEADAQGKLYPNQKDVAKAAGILVRALARVGIVGLVDEATGYQDVRARNALAKILEAYVAEELQPWIRTFPTDYYREMFRLRGLDFPNASVLRPRYFGVLTNDIVYRRLAPGVLDELKRVQRKDDGGRPKDKLFQRLTTNVGYPKLREHLGSVVTLMKLSDDWPDFRRKLDKIHPRFGDTIMLPFEDSGTGL